MFQIDTNAQEPIFAKSDVIEQGQVVRFTNFERADRTKRQIIETIESIETVEELEDYIKREGLMLDALFLFDNSMSAEIEQSYRDHKACIDPDNRKTPIQKLLDAKAF